MKKILAPMKILLSIIFFSNLGERSNKQLLQSGCLEVLNDKNLISSGRKEKLFSNELIILSVLIDVIE